MARPNYKLTDRQFDGLEQSTRRSLIQQLMIIETQRYLYSLGAYGEYWTLTRKDKAESIGSCKWADDYEPSIIDRWL